jgi:PIN domain nuclease of toxin-antitoxin system
MKNVVDTHAFLWYLAGSPRLGAQAKAILMDRNSECVLPAAVLAEACWIVEKGRVSLSVKDILSHLDKDRRFTIHPLDRAVIERGLELASIQEMHDREIVATALILSDQGGMFDCSPAMKT